MIVVTTVVIYFLETQFYTEFYIRDKPYQADITFSTKVLAYYQSGNRDYEHIIVIVLLLLILLLLLLLCVKCGDAKRQTHIAHSVTYVALEGINYRV